MDRHIDLIVVGGNSDVRSEEYKARISPKRLMKLAPRPVLVVNNKLELTGKGGERRLLTESFIILKKREKALSC